MKITPTKDNDKKRWVKFECMNGHRFGDATREWIEKCPECGERIRGTIERVLVDVKDWKGVIGSVGTN